MEKSRIEPSRLIIFKYETSVLRRIREKKENRRKFARAVESVNSTKIVVEKAKVRGKLPSRLCILLVVARRRPLSE